MTASPADRLRAVRGFVLDLDGTLVLGDRGGNGLRPLPGALELVAWLGERGLPYRIFTNGTGHSPDEYEATLRQIGFRLSGESVMTPASSAVDLFVRRGHARVLALAAGLAPPLREAGCRVELVGKPSRHALRAAGRRLGVPASQLAVVGDDPALEVPMAHRGRALAVAVGTGLGAADAFDHLPQARRPHLLLRGVDELLAHCVEAYQQCP